MGKRQHCMQEVNIQARHLMGQEAQVISTIAAIISGDTEVFESGDSRLTHTPVQAPDWRIGMHNGILTIAYRKSKDKLNTKVTAIMTEPSLGLKEIVPS